MVRHSFARKLSQVSRLTAAHPLVGTSAAASAACSSQSCENFKFPGLWLRVGLATASQARNKTRNLRSLESSERTGGFVEDHSLRILLPQYPGLCPGLLTSITCGNDASRFWIPGIVVECPSFELQFAAAVVAARFVYVGVSGAGSGANLGTSRQGS